MAERILIIDDDTAIRQSLMSVLATYGFETESHGNAPDGLAAIKARSPDCLLLDVRMPDMDGLTLLRMVAEMLSAPPVIIITGHGDVAMAVQAMKAGASDFVEKPILDDVLVSAIHAAISARRRRGAAAGEHPVLRQRFGLLTDREKTVARMVAEGFSTAAIAATLGISNRTVDHHRSSVMAKMQATSLPQLLRFLMAATSN